MPNVRTCRAVAHGDETPHRRLLPDETAEKQLEHPVAGLCVGGMQLKFVREPPPYRRIKKVGMVRRAKQHCLIAQRVDVLKQADDDALELA